MLAILPMLLPIIQQVIGGLIPDQNKAAEINQKLQEALISRQIELDKAIADAMKAQAETNTAEAKHGSMFVAGWRPFVGWVCGFGFAYAFVLRPFLAWIAAMCGISLPPVVEVNELVGLLSGMLGFGALRTVEKYQGVDRTALNRPVLKRTE